MAGMNNELNSHYAALLGLGEEWTVSNVAIDCSGMKVDIQLEYTKDVAICPECGRLVPLYDRQPERTWRHLDTMQFETLIHARPPRIICPDHKVKVIELPWAAKNSRFTLLFEAFALEVLKAARSIKDARGLLRLGWHQTHEIMAAAVRRGLVRREASEVPFIGMDEKSFRKGKAADAFACVMTDIDNRRVLDVSRGRSEAGAGELIEKALDPVQRFMVCGVAMDMSAPFEKAVKARLPNADIVFDKFHVEKHLGEGVDAVRKMEHAMLMKRNDKRLAKSKYLWLTGLEHLGAEAVARRNDLLKMSLDTGKAWGLKELFGWFWKCRDKRMAMADFEFWYEQVRKSALKPMIKVADTLKKHLYGLLAWFDSRIDNALTEGFNATIQSLKATAKGFRNFENFRIAVLFYCGKLDMRPDFVRVGSTFGITDEGEFFH